MRTGYAHLPLHGGHCPPWLFRRMKPLAKAVGDAIILEYGEEEFLKRLSDPFFFQSFGCVLGYDWHSSGVTTTVCGAIKEAEIEGIAACGGKGKTSRKTPEEILKKAQEFSFSDDKIKNLVHASKMSAKIDNTAVQDGYQLYHHMFIFTEKNEWTVIQQGMNESNKYARRYHWLTTDSFLNEKQTIACDKKEKEVLDLSAKQSEETRQISVDLVKDNISKRLQNASSIPNLEMPAHHEIRQLKKQTVDTLKKAYELQPQNYEELLAIRGMGPKAVRALALISQLVYGAAPSWNDPVKFSFSHGGKDSIPFPVDKPTYENSIQMLRTAVDNAKLGDQQKLKAIKSLNKFIS
ncbi:MAG: DUF763 domain-containing protein [Candidatus Aenigmarchaeota archaeon]|nr:DUF763 domain-containing protein [Candidatus Aenigmarchaeota archaeon]